RWTKAKAPRASVQDGSKNAWRVHPRQAHPLDVATRRDQRGDVAVRQKGIVGDGWEGRGNARQIIERHRPLQRLARLRRCPRPSSSAIRRKQLGRTWHRHAWLSLGRRRIVCHLLREL